MAENNNFEPQDLIDMSSPCPKETTKHQVDYLSSPTPITFTEQDLNQAIKEQEAELQEMIERKEDDLAATLANIAQEKESLSSQLRTLATTHNITKLITEELCSMFMSWKKQREQEQREITIQNQNLKNERDQALEDLKNVETAFADLHRRYEQAKAVLETLKQNEERLRYQLQDGQNKLAQQTQMYDRLRTHTEEKLGSANQEIENAKKSGEAELAALRAQLKKAEMKVASLEKNMEQKVRENQELSSICDELIAKVGKS